MTHDIKVRNGIWDLNADFEDCETDEVIKEHIKRTLLMTDECCSLNQNTFAGFNFLAFNFLYSPIFILLFIFNNL